MNTKRKTEFKRKLFFEFKIENKIFHFAMHTNTDNLR